MVGGCYFLFAAPFNNMGTLKFKFQLTVTLNMLPSISAADLLENNITFGSVGSRSHVPPLRLADVDPLSRFLYFCGQLVVAIMIYNYD